jgi:hypothetical protein
MWIDNVDLPVPPFSLATTMTCAVRKSGASNSGIAARAVMSHVSIRVNAQAYSKFIEIKPAPVCRQCEEWHALAALSRLFVRSALG